MLCEKCGKNEATFYYKENINGTEKAYHLCADCAKKLEESGEIRSFDGNFFDSMNKIFSGDNLFGSLFAPIGQRHEAGGGPVLERGIRRRAPGNDPAHPWQNEAHRQRSETVPRRTGSKGKAPEAGGRTPRGGKE